MTNVFNRGVDVNPVHSGLYVVDRGDKLGTPFRYFNVDTGIWGRCEYMIEDAVNSKDSASAIGWLPWRGPVKVPKAKPAVAPVELVAQPVEVAPVEVAKPKAKAKLVVSKVGNTKVGSVVKPGKVAHPDGAIVWREDRQKYMAWFGGKSEAARPTVEAAKAFLTKKYGITEFSVIK
jgi:hypothetical protein